jgi:hypothetical protein
VRRIAILLLAAATAVAAPGAAAASRSVPRGFVGTDADGPLVSNDPSLFTSQLGPMADAGVETIRMNFDWRRIEHYKTIDDVPIQDRGNYTVVDGVPNNFTLADQWMADAARRGIRIMPVLIYTPRWARRHSGRAASPPRDRGDYARFAAALVSRYGHDGSFWSRYPTLPYLPIEFWQLWNEPHFTDYWTDQPWAPDYVKLLKRTYTRIHATDSGAKVVMAGLTNESWTFLDQAYKAGAKGYFDYAAIHPFTAKVSGIVTILDKARRVMKEHGDSGRHLMVTEMSWTSARGKTSQQFGFEQDEKGQAKHLADAYSLLAQERRRLKLRAVFWYTWLTMDQSTSQPFDYAGVNKLRQGIVVKKPAYKAMRTTAVALEGCSSKSGDARSCAR